MTLKFDWWPRKTIGHLFYTTSSFVHHFKHIGEFKPELQSANDQFGSKFVIFCPVWPWNLMDDPEKQQSTSSILHQPLCIISNPSVNSNGSYSLETLNLGQNQQFFVPCDWSYSTEMAKWGHNLCDLDFWPWPFAWTSISSMVRIPENFMIIQWQELCENGVTNGQMNGRTDRRMDGQKCS